MTYTPPTADSDRKPTLDETLLYIDIFFAAPSEARDILVAEGKVSRWYQVANEYAGDAEVQADLRAVSDYASQLIGQRAYDAGLPFSVLSTERIRAAYLDCATDAAALAPTRSTYGMVAA